jgi:hypothetical protein
MGYAILFGTCAACHEQIAYNPRLVPAIRINGRKSAICSTCVFRWNELHPEQKFEIPQGAYEPVDENEL